MTIGAQMRACTKCKSTIEPAQRGPMAVQDEDSYKRYVANGVATVYAIPFLLLSAADLRVTLNAVPVTAGFTVSGIGTNAGSITFTAAPAGDLLLQRVVPFARATDYQDNGDLLAKTVNLDFDRLWLAMQELRRDDSRALSASPLEPEGIPALPIVAQRSGRVLAFDLLGNPVPSNLTLEQLEQQPTVAMAAAAAADASAAASASSAANSAASAAAAAASADAAAASAAFAGDPWALQPIGVPIPVFDHIAGVSAPPKNSSYRYIKLTASDSYNTGILTGESVSGSAPLVIATAVISLAGSPINGRTVQLINTERRSLRAGSSGMVEADAFQGHRHSGSMSFGGSANLGNLASYIQTSNTGDPVSDGTNGTPRIANETRPKNIGATFYMRIK